ncbi:hypothetical protein [Ruegeria jejuensis]|uniref:hypothetical protein n=1 Tax=Ruegeria jejuensis TaxID=3233338 RepID=UPI00355ADAC3
MLRLALVLFTLVASALAGAGVIAVLSMGYFTVPAILGAAAAGFVLAIPATWLITKRIYTATRG